jgi:hypothetical protein
MLTCATVQTALAFATIVFVNVDPATLHEAVGASNAVICLVSGNRRASRPPKKVTIMTRHELPTLHVDEERRRLNLFFPDANLGQCFDALLDDGDAEEVLRDLLVPAAYDAGLSLAMTPRKFSKAE